VRARLKQQELAAMLRVSPRTVQLREKGRVPPGKEPLVLEVLGQYMWAASPPEPQQQFPGLAAYSDMALIMELARRLDEARAVIAAGETTSTTPRPRSEAGVRG